MEILVNYKLAASFAASPVFRNITTGDIAANCAGEIDCFEGRIRGKRPRDAT
jgi:hypothetical protein